jgi:hypothetical protein
MHVRTVSYTIKDSKLHISYTVYIYKAYFVATHHVNYLMLQNGGFLLPFYTYINLSLSSYHPHNSLPLSLSLSLSPCEGDEGKSFEGVHEKVEKDGEKSHTLWSL